MISPPISAPRGTAAHAPPRTQVRVGGIWVDAVDPDGALAAVESLVSSGRGGSVFTPNVDHVVTAEDQEDFRRAYDACSLSLADGMPLVWASHLLGHPLPAKVSGSDLVPPLMALAARRGWSVYLLGGAPGVATEAARLLAHDPGVRIAGVDDARIPLLPPPDGAEPAADRVREVRPDLLLVALGAPKQELWIQRNRERLGSTVALGVGASLDFVTGRVRRAPRWMSRSGLEWLYRFGQEPRRLAVRYFVKDPRFAGILARQLLRPDSPSVRPRPP